VAPVMQQRDESRQAVAGADEFECTVLAALGVNGFHSVRGPQPESFVSLNYGFPTITTSPNGLQSWPATSKPTLEGERN
jgi:hypothetical protein